MIDPWEMLEKAHMRGQAMPKHESGLAFPRDMLAQACLPIIAQHYAPVIAENERLEALVGELGEALKPFADAAADCIDDDELDRRDVWEHAVGMNLTVGDFRKARATLAKLEKARG